MRDYKAITERIIERGEERLRKREKAAARIRNYSLAVSGMCAVLVTGIFLYKDADLRKAPPMSRPDDIIVTQTQTAETSSSQVQTSASSVVPLGTTTAASRTSAAVQISSSTQTTQDTAPPAVQTTASAPQTVPVQTTAASPVSQPEETSSQTTAEAASTDVISSTASYFVTTTTAEVPQDRGESFPTACTETFLPGEEGMISVKSCYSYSGEWIQGDLIERMTGTAFCSSGDGTSEVSVAVFTISGYSAEERIAVMFSGDKRYYVYCFTRREEEQL
ncbi:MAG: hypothetical protein IKQ90_05100 [Ruminococcus sp.]|nr:hypothetical protein [Ruminococcus sp.]